MKIFKFFENIFDGADIILARLIAFTLDHIVKLQTTNPGAIYNTIIADTQTAVQAAQTALDTEGTEKNEGKGSTVTKKAARKTMQTYLGDKEGLIKSTFGKASGIYMEFFPQGLTGFRKASDENFVTRLNTFLTTAGNHSGALPAGFITELTAQITLFANAMGYHITQEGQISPARSQSLIARHALELQLMTNIYTIALNNSDGPPQPLAAQFFDESLLRAEQKERFFKAEPAANSTSAVCSFIYAGGKTLVIKNMGAEPLGFQFRVTNVLVGNIITVNPGQTVKPKYTDFYTTGDTLMCINSASVVGKYSVREKA